MQTSFVNMQNPLITMQPLLLQCQNTSLYQEIPLSVGYEPLENLTRVPLPLRGEPSSPYFSAWTVQTCLISLAFSLLLFKYISTSWVSTSPPTIATLKAPPQVPYIIPVVGNLLSYLLDAAQLASTISQTFGASAIVRLNFLSKDIYVISGAEYLNAVWKNTRGLTSTNGINIALSNMFDTPKKDMLFFKADDSGITHDPHPRSSTNPDDRVFYLMHKATVDCLAGSHLTIAAQKFHAALTSRIGELPITDEWVEMEDLHSFLLPLISYSTVQAMCGAQFLQMFPEFVGDFWNFNTKMPKLLQGWPRWMMPTAWKARDRCIATMKKWRMLCKEDNFDGNAMIPRRWSYFSKMQGISAHGVACSDLGILWGMNSNSVPATFWLMWHIFQDRNLLTRASHEADACRTGSEPGPTSFDTTRLCNQPLLQSCYAETLRKYVAVYIIRQPEHDDAQILDYRVPKNKMIVVSSAMAHMDRRNWNTGPEEEHPVDAFWAERFLTCGAKLPTKPLAPVSLSDAPGTAKPAGETWRAAGSDPKLSEPRFSLNGYGAAWIPFGGGIHQCPGRHWVKLQMLLSFAVINAAFDIEILNKKDSLSLDMRKYGLGTLQPSEKAAFRIRRKT